MCLGDCQRWNKTVSVMNWRVGDLACVIQIVPEAQICLNYGLHVPTPTTSDEQVPTPTTSDEQVPTHNIRLWVPTHIHQTMGLDTHTSDEQVPNYLEQTNRSRHPQQQTNRSRHPYIRRTGPDTHTSGQQVPTHIQQLHVPTHIHQTNRSRHIYSRPTGLELHGSDQQVPNHIHQI